MAARQVVVKVVNGAVVVENAVRRPVRLTPDGYAGVTYASAVYPLLIGDIVDLSRAAWEVEDCNRFLLADSPIPYAHQSNPEALWQFSGFEGEWNLETSPLGHYLVFNASERVATGVVDALQQAGLSVQRWDVSHRPASDGKFYDWFARLRFKGTRDEAIAQITDALRPHPPFAPAIELDAAPAPSRLETLEASYERLLDEAVDLRERLSASEREASMLRERLASATAREAKLSADLNRALEHQKSLRDEITELSRSPVQSVETKALLAKQSDTEELLEIALAENAKLQDELQSLRNKNERGETQVQTLETTVLNLEQRLEEIADQASEQRRLASPHMAPRRGVAGFLDLAFSRLTFVLDSVEVLANLEAPSAVMRSLVQIDMGEVIGKDLESIRGWREVTKLATGIAGSESMGRIYYKPDGNRVLVSVNVKQNDKQQRRHIERLRAL